MNGKSYSKINSAVKAISNSNNLRFKLEFVASLGVQSVKKRAVNHKAIRCKHCFLC